MASVKQHADGSLSIFSDLEQKSLWRVGGSASPTAGTDNNYRAPYTIKIPLNTGVGGSAALAAWQNTSGDDLLIGHAYINCTTAQTASLIVSVGTATAAASIGTNLIDSFTATAGTVGPFDNITDKGTAGKARALLSNNAFVTVSTISSTASSFVGALYLDVTKA